MVCLTFLQFLPCFFSGNSLIHSLRIDLHRYILHYFRLRCSRLRCSARLHTDLHQKFPHLFLLLKRDSTLSYILLQMGTTNCDNLALPELSELSFVRRLGSNFLKLFQSCSITLPFSRTSSGGNQA